MDDYLTTLQRTEPCPTDAFFTKLLTIEHLCHAIDKELYLSDPSGSLPARDPKAMNIIQNYNSQIDFYPLDQLDPIQKSLVDFGKSSSLIYAHELVLHVNHNVDEFAAPFSAKSLRTCSFVDAHDFDASHQLILQRLMAASRGLLDAFLELHITDMLALPPYLYGGRVIYALVLLLKVHKAIITSEKEPHDFIKPDELNVEAYLERLVTISKLLIANDENNALSRAFLIMPQLRDWFYLHQLKRPSSADETNMIGNRPVQTHHDNGQNYTTPPSTGNQSDPLNIELSEYNAIRKNSEQLDIPGSQLDELVQPAMAPCYPPVHSSDSNSEVNAPAVATDDWFWEFFNVEMLN